MNADEQATDAGGLYRFAHAEYDVRAHELRVDGRAVAVEAKALSVLACLLGRPGETLTKDELFEAVWPGRVVTEGTLTKAVMKLRAVLGDDGQSIIRTVHGFGYRLGVPVEALSSDAPALFVPSPGQAVPFRPNWRLVESLDPERRGLVWLAEHIKTRDRRVFKFAGGADSLVTLKREITLYRLLHDSLGEAAPVVQILDWNLDEPPYFTESEWIAGGDLGQWLAGAVDASGGSVEADAPSATARTQPFALRLEAIAQTCEAVAATHGVGVVHKDLKPANVLVRTHSDGRLQIRLADFGIGALSDARTIEALGITKLGFTRTRGDRDSSSGTPLYLAPEVIGGQMPTQRSDIYALGVMLYQAIVADPRRPLAPGWEREVEDELLREDIAAAADVDPEQRLGDAAELARRLRSLEARRHQRAAAEQAERERTDALHRAETQARRNRVFAVLAVVLLVAFVVSFGFYREARHAQAEAEAALVESRREAHRNAAINRFLNEDLLEAANPLRRAPGAPEATVREALDQAEARIDARFANDPHIAASLYTTLGYLRTQFGEYESAEALYRRALEAAASLSPDDPARMKAEGFRAGLLTSLQRYDEAEALLGPLLSRAAASLGDDHERVLEWRLRWLESRSRQGVDTGYAAELEAFAEDADRVLGIPNALAGGARLAIAHGRRTGGAPELGASMAERAYFDLAGSLGSDHPNTLKALAAHAHGLMAQGEEERAVEAMATAHRLQVARFGPLVLDSLFLQNELGFMLSAVERYAEAELVFDELVALRAEVWGEQAIQLVPPLSNLAHARMRLGKDALALIDIERALALLDGNPEAPVPMKLIVMRARVDALRGLGRLDEAHGQLETAEALAGSLPEDDLRRLALDGARARLLDVQGQREQALALLERTIAAMREQINDRNPMLRTLLGDRERMLAGQDPAARPQTQR